MDLSVRSLYQSPIFQTAMEILSSASKIYGFLPFGSITVYGS